MMVYMLRSVSEGVSPSLYVPEDSSLVIDIGSTVQPGMVVSTNGVQSCEVGKLLSYKQLLEVLLAADKVITL